jgi:molecular chaperone GrpE
MIKKVEKHKIDKKRKQSHPTVKHPKEDKCRSLQKKLKKSEIEFKQVKEQLLRTAAELENVRKRTDREIGRIIQSANEKLISDLLPVLDDFERFFKASKEHRKLEELKKGTELIYQKLFSTLIDYGLKPMKSEGIPFNVDEHDALLQVKKKGVQYGIVVEEHEKGYYYNDKILRHAKVLVSK